MNIYINLTPSDMCTEQRRQFQIIRLQFRMYQRWLRDSACEPAFVFYANAFLVPIARRYKDAS